MTTFYCVLIILHLTQLPLSSAILRARLKIGAATDRRLNLLTNLIHGIQTSYVWEDPILDRIQENRKLECRRFLKLYLVKGLSDGISRNASVLFALPIILVPLAEGRRLIVSSVLTALSLSE